MIFRDRPDSFFCAGFSAIAAYGTGLHANKVATRKNSHAVDILAKNTLFTANGAISSQIGCLRLPDIWMRVELFSSKEISPVPPSNYALKGKKQCCCHLLDIKQNASLVRSTSVSDGRGKLGGFTFTTPDVLQGLSHMKENHPPKNLYSSAAPSPTSLLASPPHSHTHRPALHLYACSSPYSGLNSDCLFSSYFIPCRTIYSSDSTVPGSQCECGMLQISFSFSSSQIAAQQRIQCDLDQIKCDTGMRSIINE